MINIYSYGVHICLACPLTRLVKKCLWRFSSHAVLVPNDFSYSFWKSLAPQIWSNARPLWTNHFFFQNYSPLPPTKRFMDSPKIKTFRNIVCLHLEFEQLVYDTAACTYITPKCNPVLVQSIFHSRLVFLFDQKHLDVISAWLLKSQLFPHLVNDLEW